MYLYYNDSYNEYVPQFIDEYKTIEQLMNKIKKQCDDGHKICPDYIPTYEEYKTGKLKKNSEDLKYSKYLKNNEYLFHIPTNKEIKKLKKNDFIYIIRDYFDDEYTFYVTKNKLDNYEY